MQAKAKAFNKGFNLCVENNIRCIDVEADSKILIQVLQKITKSLWAIKYEVRQIGGTY